MYWPINGSDVSIIENFARRELVVMGLVKPMVDRAYSVDNVEWRCPDAVHTY